MQRTIPSIIATLALATLAGLATTAQAGPHDDAPGPHGRSLRDDTSWVDARQARQQARIAHGVARGEITPHERQRLMLQQRAIAVAEARAKADGVVTPWELRRLEALQDDASRAIWRQAQDDDRRDGRWDGRWDGRHSGYASRW